MKSIIFICTGNICRSAMAHQYMQKRLYDLHFEEKCMVSSCGINAYPLDRATQNATYVMKKYDVDMQKHRATRIEDVNLREYDLILCMTENHKNIVKYLYPDIENKVYTLKEYALEQSNDIDISDPWGYDVNVYEHCSNEIVKCVDKIMTKFLEV